MEYYTVLNKKELEMRSIETALDIIRYTLLGLQKPLYRDVV
jgi:hypothetical protein